MFDEVAVEVMAPKKFAPTNCDVEDACSPWVNQIGVEVELALAPKLLVGIKGKISVDDVVATQLGTPFTSESTWPLLP